MTRTLIPVMTSHIINLKIKSHLSSTTHTIRGIIYIKTNYAQSSLHQCRNTVKCFSKQNKHKYLELNFKRTLVQILRDCMNCTAGIVRCLKYYRDPWERMGSKIPAMQNFLETLSNRGHSGHCTAVWRTHSHHHTYTHTHSLILTYSPKDTEITHTESSQTWSNAQRAAHK